MSDLYEGKNSNFTSKLKELIKQGKNVFITGGAGTGKSCLLKTIYKHFNNDNFKVYIVSSTGVSAVSVKGTTIHSWSRENIVVLKSIKTILKLNPKNDFLKNV